MSNNEFESCKSDLKTISDALITAFKVFRDSIDSSMNKTDLIDKFIIAMKEVDSVLDAEWNYVTKDESYS